MTKRLRAMCVYDLGQLLKVCSLLSLLSPREQTLKLIVSGGETKTQNRKQTKDGNLFLLLFLNIWKIRIICYTYWVADGRVNILRLWSFFCIVCSTPSALFWTLYCRMRFLWETVLWKILLRKIISKSHLKQFVIQQNFPADYLNFDDYAKTCQTCKRFQSLKSKIINTEKTSERQKISLTRCFHLMDAPNWSHFLYLFETDHFVASITLCHFMPAWSFDCFRFNTAAVITSKKFSVVMKAFLWL